MSPILILKININDNVEIVGDQVTLTSNGLVDYFFYFIFIVERKKP